MVHLDDTEIHGRRALVVDTDEEALKARAAELRGLGLIVTTATTSSAALAALDAQPVDLAVIELVLEEADGGFTLSYFMKKRRPALPVLITSRVTFEAGLDFDTYTAEERRWIKADGWLERPYRLEQLAREVRRLLHHRAAA
ncbi:MAG: response regulator [Deltaproteobacteria bacterium]|nr:MAG: response regulator [Deltaproteobacteria bacterium]